MINPVHQEGSDWWFYDETWANRHGPFPSQEEANAECKRYAESLDASTGGEQRLLGSWREKANGPR